MKTQKIAIWLMLAVALVGCGKKENGGPETNGVSTGVDEGSVTANVPDNLKSEAYEWLGLGNDKLMTYDVTFADLDMRDGTQQTTLEKVEDGKATFKVERTGELAQLGIDTIEMRADGAYTVASSMGIMKSASHVLPATVKVGDAWVTRMDMDQLQGGSQKVESEVSNKAARMESVTVPAGTYECLVVTSTINAVASGSPSKEQDGKTVTNFTTYYAKGIGIVKLTGTTTLQNGTKRNVLIELKEIAAGEPKAVETTETS